MTNLNQVFENQPKTITPEVAAKLVSLARETIYDMKYRPQKYGTRREMFVKNGRKLLLRTDMLREWFVSRSAS